MSTVMPSQAEAGSPVDAAHGPGLVRVDEMWNVWHSFRIAVVGISVSSGLILGLVWRWPAGFVIAAIAAVALGDALRRRNSTEGSPLVSLLLDITLVGVAMVVAGLETAGVGGALVYMTAVPLVLLPWRRALPVIAYAAVWALVATVAAFSIELPADVESWAVSMIAYLIFAGGTLVLLAVTAVNLERSHRNRDRRLRYERALAECGKALLDRVDDGAIDSALETLLHATPAQDAFVNENFDDPILGLSARVTHEAIRRGFEDVVSKKIRVESEDPTRVLRTVVAYKDMPTAYARLAAGEVVIIHVDDLAGREREVYGNDGCKSELNIPIIVDGSWVGSLGFTDYARDREWKDEDVALLRTAAAMIGSFWERNRATTALEDAVHSKNQLVASISHEIRTPLTAVLGFSEVLREESARLGSGGMEMVGIVVEQAQEVSHIVDDLLVAAQADAGALKVVRVPVALRDEAERVLAAGARRAQSRIDVIGPNVGALGDPVRVRQIIRCLVTNAARYGGDRAEIRIGSNRNLATIAVADNGAGIPAGHDDHIFKAFHKAAATTGTTEAIGLGLHVSHHLSKLMGGTIAYRRVDNWTVFQLSLPLESTVSDAPAANAHLAGNDLPVVVPGASMVSPV